MPIADSPRNPTNFRNFNYCFIKAQSKIRIWSIGDVSQLFDLFMRKIETRTKVIRPGYALSYLIILSALLGTAPIFLTLILNDSQFPWPT